MNRRQIAIRQFVAIGFAIFAALYVIGAHCTGCGLTPKQASDDTKVACTVLEAFEGGAVVDSICATAPELASIADTIATSKAPDSGARMATRCRMIPTTTVCASDSELRAAIQKVKASR